MGSRLNLSSVTVRQSRPDERPAIVEFMADLNRAERLYRSDRDTSFEASDRHLAYLEGLILESGGFITVADSGGQLVGFLVGIIDEEEGFYILPQERTFGHVTDIFVAKEARRSGLGRTLLVDAEARFLKLGVTIVRVIGLAANKTALSTYEGCGYRTLEITFEKVLR